MPTINLVLDNPAGESVREFTDFVEDVNTFYERLVLVALVPSAPMIYSPQFRRTLHRLPDDLQLVILDVNRRNPLNFLLKVPETVSAVGKFFYDGLILVRDWKVAQRKGDLQNEKLRIGVEKLQFELERDKDLHSVKMAKARLELEDQMRSRYLEGPPVLQQTYLEGASPRLLEEQRQDSPSSPIRRSPKVEQVGKRQQSQQTDANRSNPPSADQIRSRTAQHLRRDLERLEHSNVNIRNVEDIDETSS